MTEDEIVSLGNYCETLRHNPQFKVLLDQFELQIVQHMLTTEPHEQKKREGIYASFLGVRDFLGHMDALITEKKKLTEPQIDALSEYDAQVEDID